MSDNANSVPNPKSNLQIGDWVQSEWSDDAVELYRITHFDEHGNPASGLISFNPKYNTKANIKITTINKKPIKYWLFWPISFGIVFLFHSIAWFAPDWIVKSVGLLVLFIFAPYWAYSKIVDKLTTTKQVQQ